MTGAEGSHATAEHVEIRVNGIARAVPPSTRLLTMLRDHLGLTGAKPGCGEGTCGACTVLADGEPVRSCQLSAAQMAGRQLTTIEGLREGGELHPVQEAFAAEGAAQCGYCTPGLILSSAALLAGNAEPDDDAIDAALAGHICRCGGYPRIRRAVHRAARAQRPQTTVPQTTVPQTTVPEPGAWGAPDPGQPHYRPARPWDLTEPSDRDWFRVLGDGLVVTLEPSSDETSQWTTARGAWLHLSVSGLVTVFTGKVDVGQDNRTALRLLIAEELGVPLTQILLVMGDTDICPHDRGTFGSRSMPDAGGVLRRVAAHARRLQRPRPGDRRIELVTGEPVLSDPRAWHQAGRAHRAPGTLAAVTGQRRFISDLSCPDMLHGALLRPPVPGAVLTSLRTPVLDDRPGVTLIRDGDLVGVVAGDLQACRDAIAAVQAVAGWDRPEAPSSAGLADYLRTHRPEPSAGADQVRTQAGSAATALEVAAVRAEATYTAAYIAPAALETRVALARWDDGRLTVWTGTQTPFGVRAEVAGALAVAEQDVRIVVPPTGGAFGGKHAADISIEAALLARHAGRPVRVGWSRAEEFTAGTLRRAAVIDVVAGATAAGELSGWTFLNVNAGTAGIATPYRVADQRVDYQPAHSPLRQGSYRGLAATANNFARESTIDELAAELGIDPVEFRLRNLADERLASVLRAVADHIGWAGLTRGSGRPAAGTASGWGIACGMEKDGRIATAARVAISPGGQLRVTKLVSGYECGAIVNPETVTSQVEGAAVMALGGALFEAIDFTNGMITNAAFSSYRVPRLSDVPPIEVILLDRPDLPSAGAGETPMIAVAPAIAAAIFAVTGHRPRSLPLLPLPQ
ncbi:MAG TPA: molybdopterin cofactor-binding domain-containing protein [Streptosporangiaceae bacterium]|nr:molybdopterin cofactor-binding domain-containing protein [Streptosporangiaceae bacterium]